MHEGRDRHGVYVEAGRSRANGLTGRRRRAYLGLVGDWLKWAQSERSRPRPTSPRCWSGWRMASGSGLRGTGGRLLSWRPSTGAIQPKLSRLSRISSPLPPNKRWDAAGGKPAIPAASGKRFRPRRIRHRRLVSPMKQALRPRRYLGACFTAEPSCPGYGTSKLPTCCLPLRSADASPRAN